MKKNIKKDQTTGLLFKIFTLSIFAASGALIHIEYEKHKIFLNDSAHIMKVQIERAYDTSFAEGSQSEMLEKNAMDSQKIAQSSKEKEIKENNEISSDISSGFNLKIHEYNNIESYRIYLSSVLSLIEKFLKSEDYEQELKLLMEKNLNYPKEVTEILGELSDYRVKYLNSMKNEYLKVDLNNGILSRIIGKIVDIESKNPQHLEKDESYKALSSKLDILKTYFYSSEFLKKYVSND